MKIWCRLDGQAPLLVARQTCGKGSGEGDKKHFDMVIVGSGAGLAILEGALQSGLSCALVERGKFGGTCLTKGCIPSKILVHPADVMREVAHARKVGLDYPPPAIHWETVSERMWNKIGQTRNIERSIEQADGVEVFKGTAVFTGTHTMKVRLSDGTETEPFSSDRFVLAVGGRSFAPPIPGLAETGYLDSEHFFGDGFPTAPWKRLVIIGGGAIGTEFAHIFSAFGTEVSIVEMLPHLVPTEEEAISEMLEDNFGRLGIHVLTNHKAVSVRRENGHKVVVVQDAQTEGTREVPCDEILVASGIRSNADLLHVELAGIATDKRGWIVTDEYLQTSQPHIWALGDINGKYQFRHKANYEAEVLVANLFGKSEPKRAADYSTVPWAIFTHPQIGHVGMTEKQALAKHEKVMVGVKHYSSIANGYAMGYSSGDPDDGFVKVIADEDMKILGAHVIGPQAAILVQAFVYLMNMDFCCSCGKTKRAEPLLEVAQDCHVSGSANLMNRSMVIHPALSEVAGWIVDELEWVTANVSVPGTETIL